MDLLVFKVGYHNCFTFFHEQPEYFQLRRTTSFSDRRKIRSEVRQLRDKRTGKGDHSG